MTYFIPQKHVCPKGHEFDFSPSWVVDGGWRFPVTLTSDPYCPHCYLAFIAEHVPLGAVPSTSQDAEDKSNE